MQVIDDQHRRAFGRQVGCQPVQAVQHGGRLSRDRSRPRLRVHDARSMDGRARQELITTCALGPRHHSLEELSHDGVGKSSLKLTCASRQHEHVTVAGTSRRRGQKLGLADASRTLDERQRAVARLRRQQRRVDHGELVGAFEQVSPACGHNRTLPRRSHESR